MRDITLNKQYGFTLTEVIIAVALLAIIALAAVPYQQSEMEEEVENEAVNRVESLVLGFQEFSKNERRSPASITELVNSIYYIGDARTPWGSQISGAKNVSGNAYSFTIPAKSNIQAERLAGLLRAYGSSFSGSLVTLTTPISLTETVANQMLCRKDIGVPGCNVLEVDLDVNGNNLLDIGEASGKSATYDDVEIKKAQVSRLITKDEIALGNNSISHDGSTLNFNADQTNFNGQVSVTGDVVGNNTNITGIDNLQSESVNTQQANIDRGTISQLSGNTLKYKSADLDSVKAGSTVADSGQFGTATATSVSSTNVTTNNFTGTQGTFINAVANIATGQDLTLSGLLSTANFQSAQSHVGVATGTSLTLSGNASANRFIGNSAIFSGVTVNGGVQADNFTGNDFTTSTSSVNKNKQTLDQQATLISSNTTANANNTREIGDVSAKADTNKIAIAANTTANFSNKQLADSLVVKVNSNTNAVASLASKATQVQQKADSLESQLLACKAGGGCKW